MSKKKTPTPQQPALEGMDEPRIQELSDAALSYVNARDDRMEKGKEEKRCYERLARLMGEHELVEYHDRETGVNILRDEPEVKFKVKVALGVGDVPEHAPDRPIAVGTMEPLLPDTDFPETAADLKEEASEESGDTEPEEDATVATWRAERAQEANGDDEAEDGPDLPPVAKKGRKRASAEA